MRIQTVLQASAVILGLAMTHSARAADIVITVNGKINDLYGGVPANMGYSVDQPVTFFWVINDYAPQTPVGSASGLALTQWWAETSADPTLFADAGGTGLTGTYTPSTGNDPQNYIAIDHLQNGIYFSAASDVGSIGLKTPNDLDLMRFELSMEAVISPWNFVSPWPGALPNPTVYFANSLGSYTFTGGTNSLLRTVGNVTVYWTPETMTITQVPEPSTYALGAIATGFLALAARRRKRKA